MRARHLVLLIALFTSMELLGQSNAAALAGTWEGDSVCVVENPCHTEHVIYQITYKGSNSVTIEADKVVNEQRAFMGSLDCTYDAALHRLSCPMEVRRPGDWVFKVDGETMTGTLTMREGHQLFRNIRVHRRAK